MCSQFYLLLLIFVHITTISTGGVFFVSPGDGEEFVYFPVDVNATLYCVVNSTNIVWVVNTFAFDSPSERRRLRSLRIFQTEPVTSSNGVTTSSVIVLGNLAENNNSRICCKSEELEESCTMLIIYEFFLVSPGDGERFVYSPVNVNATLHCAVNNTNLVWEVDMLALASPVHTLRLRARGIFQSEPVTSSDGVTKSSVTVLGSFPVNNNSRVCCQSVIENRDIHENCTILILYGRPSPPQYVTVQYTRGEAKSIMLNISWTATTMMGVDQNYTIHFKSHNIIIISETTVPVTVTDFYYIHQLNMYATRCGEFLAFITAVNGAGESDPSNNVTIPSLPDIGPVTASLSHQVWKQTGGEIMVNVSFKQARYCIEYPLLSYTLMLRSQQTGSLLNISINSNETKVVIGPENRLEDNQKYEYAVTAINEFGNTTSHEDGKWKYLFTSDVQSVTATVVGESTIDIQCLFIYGSDVVGCKVVLVSRCPTVEDKHATLLRMEASSISANQSLNFILNISCYHQVLVADIDVNNTIRNLTIEGRIVNKPMVNDANRGHLQLHISIIISMMIIMLLVVIIVVVILVLIGLKKTKLCLKNGIKLGPGGKFTSSNDYCHPSFKLTELKEHSASPDKSPTSLPQHHNSSHCSPQSSPTNVPSLSSPDLIKDTKQPIVDIKETRDTTLTPQAIPVYAVPDKIRKKQHIPERNDNSGSEQNEEKSCDEEEHIYHVLEKDKIPKEDKDSYHSAPEPPPAFDQNSSGLNQLPVYQDISEVSIKPKTVKTDIKSSQYCQKEKYKTESDGVTTSSEKLQNEDIEGPVYSIPERSRARDEIGQFHTTPPPTLERNAS